MDDSRNQPELENLDYKPVNSDRECVTKITGKEKPRIPTSTPPATLGFNSAVIKPETRVNKIESAEEHPEQPNQNLMIIEEIEGLMSQVNEELGRLDVGHYLCVKAVKRGLALEKIDLFQKTTLFELRKAFE